MKAFVGLSNVNLAKPEDIYDVENVTINFGKNGSYSTGIALIRVSKLSGFSIKKFMKKKFVLY